MLRSQTRQETSGFRKRLGAKFPLILLFGARPFLGKLGQAAKRKMRAASVQADAAFELWQTECSHGTVFALRVSLVRSEQARRRVQAGDSNPARNRKTGHKKADQPENR